MKPKKLWKQVFWSCNGFSGGNLALKKHDPSLNIPIPKNLNQEAWLNAMKIKPIYEELVKAWGVIPEDQIAVQEVIYKYFLNI